MKIKELLSKANMLLKSSDIGSYLLDSQLLLCYVLKMDKLAVFMNREKEISDDKCREFFQLVDLRAEKMPVKYLIKQAEFMGINFYIEPGVLIPRPDTETLVEAVMEEIRVRDYHSVCDVCCGSGAIGLSIAKLMGNVIVDCGDISETAINVTRVNSENLDLLQRVKIYRSDLLEFALKEEKKYDVIVSNPPYIRKDVIPGLMEDVKNYEPYIALCGGSDGLDFYRRIVQQSSGLLRYEGLLAFEIGYDQSSEVGTLLEDAGFYNICILKDLAGNDRVVKGIKK